MFTANFVEANEASLVKSNMGVDLRLVECHKLYPNKLYQKYSKDQLHYVIEAVQKGRKPHTQIGLKRLMKRNAAKQLTKKINKKEISELNPKSPEKICMKAVRTEFRYKLEHNCKKAKAQKKVRSQAMIKRKEHQRARRIELIKLTRKYKDELFPHFGRRLYGHGRCPKVSRQEVKDYLKTLGIVANTEWEDNQERQYVHYVPVFKADDFPSLLAQTFSGLQFQQTN